MTEDVKPEIIKRTQDLLGKYFKKPPLTEKLLRKPPFRFLHDIISAIIKETGFLSGLFTEEELNSDNIKDKEAKLAYLTKLIDVVKLITGTNLTVRASKIIAGHEPTKTNELLHAIGRALDKKVSSVEAIEHYKKSCEKKARTHTKPKPSTKEDPIKKPASRHSSQTRKVNEKEKVLTEAKKRSSSIEKTASREVKTREDDKREKKRLQEKENERKVDNPVEDTAVTNVVPSESITEKPPSSMRQKRQSSSVKSKQNVTSPKSSDAVKIKSALLDATNSPKHKPKEAEAQKSSSGTRRSSSGHHQQNELQQKEKVKDSEDASSREQKSRLSTAKEAREKGIAPEDISKKEEDNDARFSENTKHIEKPESGKSERKFSITNKQNTFEHPGSPPPRPMGTVSNSEESANISTVPNRPKTSLRPPSARPMSARPAAPRMKSKTEYIVNEDISTPMGNVNVIVENYDTKEDDADDMVVMETGSGGGDSLGIERPSHTDSQLPSEHGHLVAQILETQRELVNTDNVDVMPKKVEIVREWEAGSRRDREVTVKEVDKLRGAIQTLTRATNPLGKLLDYLQEDVEMMQRELQEWRSQYNRLSKELEKEQVETQESVEPMKKTLKDIEDLIKQELDKICQVKSNIMKNDQKMQRLLNGHL
ncbi:TRAF3-interacting protein 1 isoform X2 [Cephus cinctus]|uniref:TRAF3-interacting protein 1 n=1 Tax=Cephus cinctus TaxID=211228 RepID=A0AAJ7BTQ6_CEPCN|nr:TRAF3-interacting protein 1 isoform X2 [Cephus cinctus]